MATTLTISETGAVLTVATTFDAKLVRGVLWSTTSPTDGQVPQYNASGSIIDWVDPDSLITGGFVDVAGDTMTGPLVIDGTTDAIQLRVQGHSTQTADIFVVETSAGTDLFSVATGAVTAFQNLNPNADGTLDLGLTGTRWRQGYFDDLTVTTGVVASTLTGTLQTAAQGNVTSLGTLVSLQVDNLNLDGNTLSSTAGVDLLITPLAGQQIVLDGAIVIDAGVVTGATSITSTAFVGALTGNADTATVLQTPRDINGVAFDGSANITITSAAGTLTGATLNATVTASSLTSLGTIGSLVATEADIATLSRAGDQTIDLTGAATRTLTLQNSTASRVANLDVDGVYVWRAGHATGTFTFAGTPTVARTLTWPDASITVNAAADISGTTLASGVVTSSLTTIGTLVGGAVPANFVTAATFAAGTFSFAGSTISDLGSVTTVDINGGTVGGVTLDGTISGTPTWASSQAIVLSTASQPNITALGTIISLVATTADINGGTIDGTAIGGSVAAAGSFTTLGLSGRLTINGAAGTNRELRFETSGSSRWQMRANSDAEGGSEAGSNFSIDVFNDAGALVGAALSIVRATRAATFPILLTATSGIKLGTTVTLTEGVANRLDLASGDDFYIVAGNLFIGVATNSKMTVGLTINQGASDDEILALKSSDVAHGVTDPTETDTFATFRKASGASGGLALRGYSTSSAAVFVDGVGTTDVTTKGTASLAYVNILAFKKSGTGIGDAGANANLLMIRNNATTRFIFDAEGSAHADVEWVPFDTHSDLAVLEDFEMLMAPGQVQRMFGEAVTHDRSFFEREGLIHDIRTENGRTRGMVNFSRLAMLNTGVVRQVGSRQVALENCLRSIIDSNHQLTGRDEALALLVA